MNKFIQKAQQLGQKAAQIRAAVEGAPAKVAELRQTVTATTGQLMQLRSEVQTTLNDLRLGSEDELISSLKEVEEQAPVFREVGYELSSIELELGVAQRLMVRLEKFTDVSHSMIRHAATANEGRRSVKAILEALMRAEELSERVDLATLEYWGLEVSIGMAPAARLLWAVPTAEDTAVPPTAPATTVSVAASNSPFVQSSYFERRTPLPAARPEPTVAVPAVEPAIAAAVPIAAAAEEGTGDWRRDALARFKKMPDFSKPRR